MSAARDVLDRSGAAGLLASDGLSIVFGGLGAGKTELLREAACTALREGPVAVLVGDDGFQSGEVEYAMLGDLPAESWPWLAADRSIVTADPFELVHWVEQVHQKLGVRVRVFVDVLPAAAVSSWPERSWLQFVTLLVENEAVRSVALVHEPMGSAVTQAFPAAVQVWSGDPRAGVPAQLFGEQVDQFFALLVDELQELLLLPSGSIVRDAKGQIVLRADEAHGLRPGRERPMPWLNVRLPARVLHREGA